MKENQNATYILECRDKTLYTGWTNNIEKRIEMHNSNQGAKYTRGRTPVKLVYLELHTTKQEAMSREVQIKRLTRMEKKRLIMSPKNFLGQADLDSGHTGHEEIHHNEVADTASQDK